MNETSTLNIPVFYACTAATLDGPPLEVAWAALAFETHQTHGVVCGSHLIRPAAAWISELARDASALQPYRLTLSDLRDFGTPPREIAAHMNEAPEFALRRSDADELIAELARLQCLPNVATARVKREAAVMCLTGIRAEAKARFLATYWGLVAGRD